MNRLQALPAAPQTMPVLFVGHGNPMNAISRNVFTENWQAIGKALPKPKAILSVSAHWLTRGDTQVLTADKPQTIHDFYGFSTELFEQQYPSPGAPQIALQTQQMAPSTIETTEEWGLDHGTWSVLLSMFPKADIPVYQISIDYRKPPQFHYDLAAQLKALRSKGVLVMASGNLVHNLQKMQWQEKPAFDWALEFNHRVKEAISQRDDATLIDFNGFGALGKMAHPSYDHYLPLLYSLGLRSAKDEVFFFNDIIDMSSVSMLSFIYIEDGVGTPNIRH
ncbi:4,5-DOPA dioxygenase extradiol [Thiomicrorhabdus sp. HH1]|uniref:4,5-DOPA dioxygenase extradiol n=2 Tax=Piscirickettsiaceae TaxID=135616 RepID=A0ABS0C409_9GAMM|nr:4,5-DOPA dioxygenase extradiol [Thiomicrorhabdus heinhorstiae]